LQQAFTELVRTQFRRSGTCEKRIGMEHATILGSSPASSLVLQLHFERWSCGSAFGQSTPVEIAEGEGTLEFSMTPRIEKSNSLAMVSEFKRVDGVGMMQEEMRTGDLGLDLREKIAAAILAAVDAGLNPKTTLPNALQGGYTLRGARFQELAAGGLSLVVEREMQLSSAQVTSLANQLNQALSASGATSH